jgi:hypothetical protein
MKAKVFDVILHRLPAGKSPSLHLEEQLNNFLGQQPHLKLVATHMNTLILPAELSAVHGTKPAEAAVVIFSTLFYE